MTEPDLDPIKIIDLNEKEDLTSLTLPYFESSVTGNIILDSDTENYIGIKDENGIIRVKIGKIGTNYGVAIYDTSGNILANLYDPTAFEIKKGVKIEPAWDGGWQASGASGTYIQRSHNLGYFPSSAQLWGGNANPPSLIYDESFYASMDISWISISSVKLYFLNNASHGLPPRYRIVLFR